MRQRLVLVMLLALHLGLRLAVWQRPIRQLDDLVLPDDAYLALHLARSIAHTRVIYGDFPPCRQIGE